LRGVGEAAQHVEREGSLVGTLVAGMDWLRWELWRNLARAVLVGKAALRGARRGQGKVYFFEGANVRDAEPLLRVRSGPASHAYGMGSH